MTIRQFSLFFILLSLVVGCSDNAPRSPSATSNVKVLSVALDIPHLNRSRTLRLYLPPGYEQSDTRYPVLYMHDAQNLFDDATSYAGEWRVDEALNQLASTDNLELIVVGIDNGQSTRMNEYSPWANEDFGPAEGKEYMAFVVGVVKPFIDKNYRTRPDATNTGIMGSSMGGLISHYAAIEYPDVFSKVGIYSPSYWYSKEVFSDTRVKPFRKTAKLAFLVGDDEGEMMVDNMQKMVNQVVVQGHPEQHIQVDVVPDGEHNESFWAAHFSDTVRWLFSDNK